MGRNEPPSDEGQRSPALRVGGYVKTRRAARHRAPEAIEQDTRLPRISDYWPDAPHRLRAQWEGFLPLPPNAVSSVAVEPEDERPATTLDRRWPIMITGVLALSVVAGTMLLARPLAESEIRQQRAALPPSAVAIEPQITAAPMPPPLLLSPTPAQSPSPTPTGAPDVRSARLEFVTGVTDLSVRIADLGDLPFDVGSSDGSEVDANTTFSDGVLRIEINSAGSNGSVEVRLSNRIVWGLQLSAGVKSARFDTTAGSVSRIDLDGGAESFNLVLGRLTGIVPIRMTGGVSNWRIWTDGRVPARVTVGDGAGNVVLYGDENGGTAPGAVVRSGDLDGGTGLDVDAAAGVGYLEISSTDQYGRGRTRR
ncbi:hypothetical protein [Actinoplanes sichuanensis]|uniref:Adhesin domain-containing protein n=1 Tax=Actinoplanes sichuanensis TaxID=512349 RepID=A0ABW4A6E4_9ACTN|nr:hypothetical protein [Actinoplanes sichuanensis]